MKNKHKLNHGCEFKLDLSDPASFQRRVAGNPTPSDRGIISGRRVSSGTVGFVGVLLLALMVWAPVRLFGDSITATVTVDNGYAFGFGDVNGIYPGQFYGGVDNCSAGAIFNNCYVFVPPDGTVPDTGPEIYYITNASVTNYIYIVAWSDDSVDQGTVASFTDNTTGVTVTTSPAWPWQVFATGTNWAPNCSNSGTHGPPLTGFPYAINNQIAIANSSAGGPGSSVTWVGNIASANGRLDFSGQFGHSYPFAVPSCIGPNAVWMEYNPEPTNFSCNPFKWGSTPDYTSIPNFLREYLIYRIGPVGQIFTTTNTCTNGCITIYNPNDIVVTTCSNSMVVNFTVGVSDACCSNCVTVVSSPPSGYNFPLGTTTVTSTATDNLGNTNICTFTVTVLQNTNPPVIFSCPTNIELCIVSNGCGIMPDVTTEVLATNSLGGSVTITQSIPPGTSICSDTDVTFTATDACGDATQTNVPCTLINCSSNCLQISCPSNIVVTTCSNCVPVFYPPATATDPCCTNGVSPVGNGVTLTYNPPSGSCFPLGSTTVTVTAVDGCSNMATCSFTVSVLPCPTTNCIDLVCPADMAVTACGSNCTVVNFAATATDYCCTNGVTLTYNPASGSCFPLGTNVVNVMATDGCGNSNSCSFIVTVSPGTNPPVFLSAPTNVTICEGVQAAGAVIVDSDEWDVSDQGFAYEGDGPTYATNTAAYLTDNQTHGTNILIYSDNFSLTGFDFTNTLIGAGYNVTPIMPPSLFPTSLTNYSAVYLAGDLLSATVIAELQAFICNGGGVYIAAGTGTIPGGGPGEAAQWNSLINAFGLDMDSNYDGVIGALAIPVPLAVTASPVMAGLTNIFNDNGNNVSVIAGYPFAQVVASYGSQGIIGVSACTTNAGNCGPMPDLSGEVVVSGGTFSQSIAPGTIICADTNVILTVTNICGESTNLVVPVTLVNCASNCFSVQCPTNKTVQCGSDWIFDPPTATTCCSNNVSGTTTNLLITSTGFATNGACPQLTITETWQITDGCGDSTNCSQTVTVLGCCSNGCLQVRCPTNKTVDCGSTWTFDSPQASTCCPSNIVTPTGVVTNVLITATGTVTNGSCPKFITQTWQISDGCGDSEICTQQVTVVDTMPPVVNCQTNSITVPLNTNCQLVIPPVQISATDNCTSASELIYSQSPPAGTIASGHSQLVTVTVTDLCGNSNQCQVLVIGQDLTPPTLICPKSLTVTNCLVPCVLDLVTAVDNCCSNLVITQSPPCNTVLGPGINSVTVTVTDCSGNSTTRVIHLNTIGSESFLGSLFNTGVSNSGALLVQGTVDPHYSLGPVPAGTLGYTAPDAVAVTNLWGWLEINHVSEWIAPTLNHLFNCPSGYYTYTNQFVLPVGADAGSASISGRWAADDGGSMYFNGNLLSGNTIPVSGSSGFNHWHPFTINSGFLAYPNTNTILFVVTNSILYNPSPTGLRVEYTNALVNCYTCAPPAIISMTGGGTVPQGFYAFFHVSAAGTPPLSYQWYHNGVPLSNNGHDSGVTTPNLLVYPVNYADAGMYCVVVSDPCGSVTNCVQLRVVRGWQWWWGWWAFAQLDNPMAATVGPDLVLVGTNTFGLGDGSTVDFGLPNPDGQIVNVLDVPPLPSDTSIQIPVIAPPGSNSVPSYSVIMDLYQPDTSAGTESTLFLNGLNTNEPDGVAVTLDPTNYLHLTGSAGGTPFNVISTVPLPGDTWSRVALVVDDPQDGVGVHVSLYLNGQPVAGTTVPTSTGLPVVWNNSPPTILSAAPDAPAPNSEFYVSSIQFHAAALTSEQVAGIGSPENGSMPAGDPSVGAQPVLSATVSNDVVTLSWSGDSFVLQETTDLTSGQWMDSMAPFTESDMNGTTGTTVHPPSPNSPAKFYRLVFRP